MGAYHAPLMRHQAPRLMRHHALFPIAAGSRHQASTRRRVAWFHLDSVWTRLVLSSPHPDRPRLVPFLLLARAIVQHAFVSSEVTSGD